MQRELAFVEARRILQLRRGEQVPVECIGPAVVGAADHGAADHPGIERDAPARITHGIADARPAMAADVIVGVQGAFLAAHHDHAFAGDIEHLVIAGSGHVFLASGAEPLAVEDRGLVARVGVGCQIGGTRQRLLHATARNADFIVPAHRRRPSASLIRRLPYKRHCGTHPVPKQKVGGRQKAWT